MSSKNKLPSILEEKNKLKEYVQGLKKKILENIDLLLQLNNHKQEIETIRNEIKNNSKNLDIDLFSDKIKELIKSVNDLPRESQQVLDFLNTVDTNNIRLIELDKKYKNKTAKEFLTISTRGRTASRKSASVNNRESPLLKPSPKINNFFPGNTVQPSPKSVADENVFKESSSTERRQKRSTSSYRGGKSRKTRKYRRKG